MIARQIKPEEIKRTEELFSISFDSPYNNEATPAELYKKYISAPQNREQERCLERFAAFEDDNTTMMSSFIMQPFDIFFDGHFESMFSIGGVSTLPQYRKRGGIRACFKEALPYMYDQGIVFSYLYPFSTSYYRKFGYEMCCQRFLYRVSLAHIPAFSLDGSCYLLDSSTAASAAEDIPSIYNTWQTQYNMMVKGISYDYSFIPNANPYKEQSFTYVYRSSEGKALAYMTLTNNTDLACRELNCSRFFYINVEGLQGLLALAKTFAADYNCINFSLPADTLLETILPEWSMGAVECRALPHGMVRAVNVKKILSDARYIGSGTATLQILDSWIPENNNTFQVFFENGHCTEVLTVSEEADIVLPVSAFSALISGRYDASQICFLNDVTVNGNMENISNIFYRKPLYITHSF